MTKIETPVLCWVCEDCYFAAVGYDEHELGRALPAETLSLMTGGDITPGMMRAHHAEDCPNFDGDTYLGCSDEPCETLEFSWAGCEGCGDGRGGSRHALTLWVRN